MLVTVWTVVGGVTGITAVAGVVIGLHASRRARRAADDCRRILAGQAAGGAGGVAGGDLRAIRDVAVFRYDALEGMTGRLSFSVAMLNGFGDGVVLTSISTRSENRSYVRSLRGGKGHQPLSPEEEYAVRAARLGRGPDVEPPPPAG
ncbi:DUF4446 family protein [Streptosporangium sp. NPDC051022]|uniref:DUF4446 family protein n=1 Tax=Streptosporangium sp. NPDC051022 TaxID=3155752 RepID=UPI003420C97E